MFEEKIEFESGKLLNLIGENRRFTFINDILQNPAIHDGYKSYFKAEVEWWLYEEQLRRQSSKNFDFEDPEITNHLKFVDSLLTEKARFDRTGLRTICSSSVQTRLNYLLRPRTTLKWFIFRGEPTKSFGEVTRRLAYFYEYEYILTGFIEYITANHIVKNENDLLSVIEFERIIETVDNNYIYSITPEEFILLLEPIYSFFSNSEKTDDHSVIPVEALLIMLDDKGIEPIIQLIEQQYSDSGVKIINRKEIMELINRMLIQSEGISN